MFWFHWIASSFTIAVGLMLLLLLPPAIALEESISPSISEIIQAKTLPTKALLQAGATAFQAGDYLAALEAFSQAIQQGDRSTVLSSAAYSNRCLTYIQLEDYQNARVDCTEAIVLNPNDKEAYLNRGLAQYRLGDAAAAIADYTQLLQLTPYDYRAYYNRGLARVEMGQYREAVVDYSEALRQTSPINRPTLAEIYNDRGLAQLMLENHRRAIADFTQAIQFNATDVRAYYNRACACHQQGDDATALRDFTQVLQLQPDAAEALLNRGLIRHSLGDREGAIADLQQAAQHFEHQGSMLAYQQTLLRLRQLQASRLALS